MKYYKVKKNADFQKIFKKGKKVFSPYITFLYYPSDKLSLGIAVSKKHGKAVRRNRIKRLLKESFRATCDKLGKNYSIILIPKVTENYTLENFKHSLSVCYKKVEECRKN